VNNSPEKGQTRQLLIPKSDKQPITVLYAAHAFLWHFFALHHRRGALSESLANKEQASWV
jgi:hypothetical protein